MERSNHGYLPCDLFLQHCYHVQINSTHSHSLTYDVTDLKISTRMHTLKGVNTCFEVS